MSDNGNRDADPSISIRDEPAGLPISAALSLPIGARNRSLRETVTAIDRVHGDGNLPRCLVVRRPLPPGLEGGYDPTTGEIEISTFAAYPALTLLHEIGHLLDQHGIGQSRRVASSGDERLDTWRGAILASRALRLLRRLESTTRDLDLARHLRYLRRMEELWARSYAQYVATRSGDSSLLAQIDRRRRGLPARLTIPYYWDDDDFADVAASLDDLFRRLGWRRNSTRPQSGG